MPVIGFLGSASAAGFAPQLAGFHRGLAEAGFTEGRNLAIEYRWADDQHDRLPKLAADLVRRQVAVIHASGPPAALAAKAATSTIPIVFSVGFDPVAAGLVASLSHPGGNATGFTLYIGALVAKKLEMLREMVPNASHLGMLVNPTTPSAKLDAAEMETAARAQGQQVRILNASTDQEIEAAFDSLARQRANAILVGTDTFYFNRRDHLVAQAARHRIPVIYYSREFVTAGGLMSYGANIPDVYRQTAIYVVRVLKGEKPADLPVLQPTRFELVINRKTAKALGLTIPQSILLRADEVIE